MAIEQDSRAKELDRARSTIQQQTTEIQQLRTSVDTLEERARDDAGELSPNPPKDTDGRREGSGRGWVREL